MKIVRHPSGLLDGLQRSESNKPIIYQPLHGDFTVKGTNKRPAKSLTTDRVGRWLKYDPSATTQPVQEMQNFLAAQFLPLSDREASAYAGEAESHQTGAATADAQSIPVQGKWLGQVIKGYFNFHAVPTNSRALGVFRHRVTKLWRRVLQHRSHKAEMTWDRMRKLANDWLRTRAASGEGRGQKAPLCNPIV